jgi:anti-anti-sigma factor
LHPIVSFDAEHATLVVVGEEHRLTSGCRRRALSSALKASRDVVVDLRELSFADSSLMLDLAALARRLRQRGRALLLVDPQPQVQRLIELMGVDRLPAVALST